MPTPFSQSIELRLAIPADFASITEIRQPPKVAPQQYRLNYWMWLEIWLARLNADVSAERFEWQTTSIVYESAVIGHISEFRTFTKSGFSDKNP